LHYILRTSEKLAILQRLLNGQNITEMIDRLDNRDVIGLQKFLWEITAEFGIICRKKNFSRKEITRKMTPTSQFQKQHGCTERSYHCKATQCIHTHSECARMKIKEQIQVMTESLHEYLKVERKNELFEAVIG